MIRPFTLALCVLATAGSRSTCAHSVWIEPRNGQLVIRFAEPGGDLETSPGYLDHLTAPVAFVVTTNNPVPIESAKKSDHFLLVGSQATNTACAETTFTVRGGRKPCFYARWQPSIGDPSTPRLTLDLVPTGKRGEVRIYFRGQPLGSIKATLRTPSGTEAEITADPQGLLHFAADEPGQYLLTVAHYREPLAGFHEGVPYEETSHNSSLVWRLDK